MEQIRQNTYVERELRRRKIEKRYKIINKVKEIAAAIALVVVTESILLAIMIWRGF